MKVGHGGSYVGTPPQGVLPPVEAVAPRHVLDHSVMKRATFHELHSGAR